MKLLQYALFILLFTPGITNANFNDVSNTHPHYTAIVWAQEHGIVQGYNDGSFKPENTISRVEFLKILLHTRFESMIDSEQYFDTHGFSDVPEAAWYYRYTLFAWQRDIIDGYPDGTFKPHNSINTAEAAKILVNVFHGSSPVFNGTYWYEDSMQYLQNVYALPNSAASPSHLITRSEMVEMVYRLAQGQ